MSKRAFEEWADDNRDAMESLGVATVKAGFNFFEVVKSAFAAGSRHRSDWAGRTHVRSFEEWASRNKCDDGSDGGCCDRCREFSRDAFEAGSRCSTDKIRGSGTGAANWIDRYRGECALGCVSADCCRQTAEEAFWGAVGGTTAILGIDQDNYLHLDADDLNRALHEAKETGKGITASEAIMLLKRAMYSELHGHPCRGPTVKTLSGQSMIRAPQHLLAGARGDGLTRQAIPALLEEARQDLIKHYASREPGDDPDLFPGNYFIAIYRDARDHFLSADSEPKEAAE